MKRLIASAVFLLVAGSVFFVRRKRKSPRCCGSPRSTAVKSRSATRAASGFRAVTVAMFAA